MDKKQKNIWADAEDEWQVDGDMQGPISFSYKDSFSQPLEVFDVPIDPIHKNQVVQRSEQNLSSNVKTWDPKAEDSVDNMATMQYDEPDDTSELINHALTRLRIIEDDRDILKTQVAQLQSLLDRERKAREVAQEASARAKRAAAQRRDVGEERARRDAEAVERLEAQVASLRRELESNYGPLSTSALDAPEPAASAALRRRAEDAESAAAPRLAELRRSHDDLIMRLAVTLKVLQLQKAAAAAHVARRARVRAAHEAVLRRLEAARAARHRWDEDRKTLSWRLDALVASATSAAAAAAGNPGGRDSAGGGGVERAMGESLARRLREETERLRRAEETLGSHAAAAEQDLRLHQRVERQHLAEAAGWAAAGWPGGPGPGPQLPPRAAPMQPPAGFGPPPGRYFGPPPGAVPAPAQQDQFAAGPPQTQAPYPGAPAFDPFVGVGVAGYGGGGGGQGMGGGVGGGGGAW